MAGMGRAQSRQCAALILITGVIELHRADANRIRIARVGVFVALPQDS
jgi:hypothetical protein